MGRFETNPTVRKSRQHFREAITGKHSPIDSVWPSSLPQSIKWKSNYGETTLKLGKNNDSFALKIDGQVIEAGTILDAETIYESKDFEGEPLGPITGISIDYLSDKQLKRVHIDRSGTLRYQTLPSGDDPPSDLQGSSVPRRPILPTLSAAAAAKTETS